MMYCVCFLSVKWIVLFVVVLYVCNVVMMLMVGGSWLDVIDLVIDRFRNDIFLKLSFVVSLVDLVISFLCVLML